MSAKDTQQRTTEVRDEEGGFLSRWSRRKLEAEADPQPAANALAQAPEEPAERSENAELTDADMPPLESLDENSDYRGFLSPKVSETLRKEALRKLFRQSRFNLVDGLDDYAEDFTRFEPLGDLVTHEMRRLLEAGRKAMADASGSPPSEEPAPLQETSSSSQRDTARSQTEAAPDSVDVQAERKEVG